MMIMMIRDDDDDRVNEVEILIIIIIISTDNGGNTHFSLTSAAAPKWHNSYDYTCYGCQYYYYRHDHYCYKHKYLLKIIIHRKRWALTEEEKKMVLVFPLAIYLGSIASLCSQTKSVHSVLSEITIASFLLCASKAFFFSFLSLYFSFFLLLLWFAFLRLSEAEGRRACVCVVYCCGCVCLSACLGVRAFVCLL